MRNNPAGGVVAESVTETNPKLKYDDSHDGTYIA